MIIQVVVNVERAQRYILVSKTTLHNNVLRCRGVIANYAIPNKLTKSHLKVINQNCMFFADFSVNSQQIFMKFNKHIFSKESQQP